MAWELDHVLLVAHDLPRSIAFYEQLLGTEATQLELAPRSGPPAETSDFAHLLGADGTSLHLARPIPNVHAHYPERLFDTSSAHVAMTVDDVAASAPWLDERGWPFRPPGSTGPTGYLRLYSEEPSASLVELNQRVGAAASGPYGSWRLAAAGLASYDIPTAAAWFAGVLAARHGDGRFEDAAGRRLELRTPNPKRWLDPVARVTLAVARPGAVAERLARDGIATRRAANGSLYVADPSRNVLRLVSDQRVGWRDG